MPDKLEPDALQISRSLAEGSGSIEFKRSCLWSIEKDEQAVQSVLMRLANANRDIGGFIELGREDNGDRVGLVDNALQPVSERQLRAAEQKLVQIAQHIDPPMQIRWHRLEQDGIETILVQVPGRPAGGWYQDSNGVTKTGSASHPVIAKQSLLQRWALETAVERSTASASIGSTDWTGWRSGGASASGRRASRAGS